MAKRKKKQADMDWLPAYIEKKCAEKARKRKAVSVKLMKRYKGLYDCAECIHGIINSCQDKLTNGCEYFSDEVTGRRFSY